VQVDAHLAVVVALVAEGVLDANLVAGGRVGEDVVAHCLRRRAVEVDLVVAEGDVLPALAAVDRKAGILALDLSLDMASAPTKYDMASSAVGRNGFLVALVGLKSTSDLP